MGSECQLLGRDHGCMLILSLPSLIMKVGLLYVRDGRHTSSSPRGASSHLSNEVEAWQCRSKRNHQEMYESAAVTIISAFGVGLCHL